MIIAVASGKGGTGKTTIATAMAQSAKADCTLLDCDVEEPNAHIFIKGADETRHNVAALVPQVDEEKCTLCGKCSEVCEFNAVAALQSGVMIFEELCHSCGGCALICSADAISEIERKIGIITESMCGGVRLVEGRIDVGHSLVPPVIRAVKKHVDNDGLTIVDCPPGTACPAVVSINGCDYAVLVTEDTPFGLYDLKLAVDVVRQIDIPFGVIINKKNDEFKDLSQYIKEESIDLLLEIPESLEIAKAYSSGRSVFSAKPSLKGELASVIEKIGGCVK